VVVSDLKWARDELVAGENALLAPFDAAALAATIESVLADPDLGRRLGAAGRALAAAELDPAACTARIDALYREVVEARP